MDGLLAGVGLAALYHFRPELWSRLTRHGNALLLPALALLGGAYFLCADLITFRATAFGYPLVDAGYAVLVLAALSPGCLLSRFDSRLTGRIAAISYSLYLVHKPLVHLSQVVLGKYGFDADSNTVFMAASVVAVLGGWALHLGVERPALRLRDRLLKRTAWSSVRQDARSDQCPASLDLERRTR
jgi:peptidoglycan/LPS O-acetylase OafA/YrhL